MIKEWNGKRYHSLNYFLRNKFGEKIYKISLDGGFTCPNRDGKVAKGGCTFCSAKRIRRLCWKQNIIYY